MGGARRSACGKGGRSHGVLPVCEYHVPFAPVEDYGANRKGEKMIDEGSWKKVPSG